MQVAGCWIQVAGFRIQIPLTPLPRFKIGGVYFLHFMI